MIYMAYLIYEYIVLSAQVDGCIDDMVGLGETPGIAAELCAAAFLA